MSLLYLDSSAITKLVIEEPETASLQAAVGGRALASTRVAVVEVGKAVVRSNPAADPQPVFARLAMVELDADLASTAAGIGGATLRALDAIHIASALRLGSELDAFITYDARQADAARLAGLRVESPTSTVVSP
ncbi:type II toxin-antitoxin system VapC family toxin [soil metagenome]